MRLTLTTVAAASLLATCIAGSAYAHGGTYRPPAGEVPPDTRPPEDPPPPPEGDGPGTPGGEDGGGPVTGGGGDVGGPGTGGGDGGGGKTGGGGPPDSGGGDGGGPKTGGPGPRIGGKKGPGYEDWSVWWSFNRDEVLALKRSLKATRRGAPTGSGAHRIGRRGSGDEVRTATDTAIQTQIVPELRRLLEEKDLHFDVRSAAALALAKIGDATIVERLEEMARNEGPERFHRVVEESAALAFGLLQRDTPEIRECLVDLVRDRKRDSSFVRPFAAVSLGLLGAENDEDGVVARTLLSVVDGRETRLDVKPACLLAVGLLGDEAQCEALLAMLRTRRTPDGGAALEPTETAFAIQALGRIGRPGTAAPGDATSVVDELLRIAEARSKDEDRNVRRSAAIVLGRLAGPCDGRTQARIVRGLKEVVEESRDDQERHFAVVALGRIGADRRVATEVRADVLRTLRNHLERSRERHLPTFAAVALGLAGRSAAAAGEPVDDESIRAPIRRRFLETTEPLSRGAYAIASGLSRDPRAVRDLMKVLEDRGAEARLRGHCAVALGLIGDASAKDAIHRVLLDVSDRELRVQTAVAAGLMGDPGVIPDLVAILTSGEDSQYILGSVALALGQIGDERAVEPLLAIVRDERTYPDLTRALATVALGQIGDRADVPTLSRVGTDLNYRTYVPALSELLTIL